MKLLNDTVRKLCRGEKLDESQMDHPLEGNYQECRECHIKFNWILVYEIIDSRYLKVSQLDACASVSQK